MANDSSLADSPLHGNTPETPFERIRQIDPDGNEFWSARDLMPILEYAKWQRFQNVIKKAQIACENSGYDPDEHFTGVGKLITAGHDSKREIEDFHLSRYACYLIVQNADPSKDVVALGQTYFAIQTRRQELQDLAGAIDDQWRLLLRERIKDQNADLASAAKQAGVITPRDFAVFQNHGYQGLYDGLTAQDIHKKKNLKKSQNILDHMGHTELAANLFRTTQAEEKLRRDHVQGKDQANQVHHDAGVVVRRAIAELGGTMPEDLLTVDSIKKLERAEKKRLAAQNTQQTESDSGEN
jgi:DNA-damage-inducible protein D